HERGFAPVEAPQQQGLEDEMSVLLADLLPDVEMIDLFGRVDGESGSGFDALLLVRRRIRQIYPQRRRKILVGLLHLQGAVRTGEDLKHAATASERDKHPSTSGGTEWFPARRPWRAVTATGSPRSPRSRRVRGAPPGG